MSFDRSMADSLSQRRFLRVGTKLYFSRENSTFALEGCFNDVFEWWHRLVKFWRQMQVMGKALLQPLNSSFVKNIHSHIPPSMLCSS